jgi:putative polyketide hydroxylase
VTRDGAALGIHDLFTDGYTLLAGAQGHRWHDAATAIAGRGKLPLSSVRIAPDGTVVAADGAFESAYGLEPDGAVIVRPDGVVAWKSPQSSENESAENAEQAVEGAMARLLGRA